MEFIDIVLLIIIGGFAMFGFWFGFVHTLGSFLGTILGAYLGTRYYEPMADWLIATTGWGENLSRVMMFVIAFIVINRLVGFAFWIVDKIFKVFTSLPFIKGLNRMLGMILGFIEGVVTIGLIIFFIERVPLSEGVMNTLANSTIAPMTSWVGSILWPLLPDALQMLHSTVDYVENIVL